VEGGTPSHVPHHAERVLGRGRAFLAFGGAWGAAERYAPSSSSMVRGQSSFSSRDRLRSASSLPPVWHRGQ
jgi:hypothetical protein